MALGLALIVWFAVCLALLSHLKESAARHARSWLWKKSAFMVFDILASTGAANRHRLSLSL
jgi:hypothetical protein